MRLTERFVSGEIASEAYKSAATILRQQIADADKELERLARDPDAITAQVEALLRRATTVFRL